MQNHYHTLGLSESASPDEIKAAFKRLAVKYHPDKHMGDRGMEEIFKSVNQAYQILSDPYKKAQFDLQLQYEHFHASQRSTTSAPPRQPYHYQPPKTKRYGGRPYYTAPPINHRENNKATLYAFGITFGIALMVMFAKGMYDLYLQKKYDDLLANRREIFVEAQSLYDQDQIRASMIMLADLAPFKPEEQDMKEFRSGKMEDIIFKGEDSYLKKDFASAIRYYELVEQFSPYRPMAMRARLAQSYRYVDKPELSIRKLKELIEENYQVIPTLVQIAEVYDEGLGDLNHSRDYLELARDVAIRDYSNKYGKAYMMIVSEKFIPLEHYFLYENLAKIYNRMDQPEESIGASNWMKRIWQDSVAPYKLAAESYLRMGDLSKACKEYEELRKLGFSEPLPVNCR